jgi:hypothetical protein
VAVKVEEGMNELSGYRIFLPSSCQHKGVGFQLAVENLEIYLEIKIQRIGRNGDYTIYM